jgi:hypothetical protein
MKCIANLATTYIAGGFLTLLHWEVVCLKGVPLHDFPFDRVTATLVMGGEVLLTWPSYWIATYQLGGPWL